MLKRILCWLVGHSEKIRDQHEGVKVWRCVYCQKRWPRVIHDVRPVHQVDARYQMPEKEVNWLRQQGLIRLRRRNEALGVNSEQPEKFLSSRRSA
jgi:heterodisulfide reductase subunit C